MISAKKISLILPTLNRKKELHEFLLSIEKQDVQREWIEVIIVDQNKKGFLDDLLANFEEMNIIYVHSQKKGLSFNRNVGLAYATGEVIAFPDDDCVYSSNTISTALHSFKSTDLDFVIGQIFDLENVKKVIKAWPSCELKITKFNFYFLSSSITLFVKQNMQINFDESMGVGAYYGSCEDPDFIYRLLCLNAKGKYFPSLRVHHPAPNLKNISREKVVAYASGFGYFVAKHRDIYLLSLLLLLILKKLIQIVESLFGGRKFYKGYFVDFFKGLIFGLRN